MSECWTCDELRAEVERLRADIRAALERVEELERANELLGKGHTGVAAAIAAEYRAKAAEAKVARLREALEIVEEEATSLEDLERPGIRFYRIADIARAALAPEVKP